ncbi:amidase [Halalkalicoccus tibetensis]|uniref:Amidase n=1 Tax=Halalkalicoccus tibetensis TaxID=175632 RepID=A0ABD5V6K8_9EURY
MDLEVGGNTGVTGPVAPETAPELSDAGTPVPSAVADERFDPFTSAAALAERIRAGRVSPVEVVELFLDRIEARDGGLNAFVTVIPERARAAAIEAERAVARGDELGALHGVPFGVKDVDSVTGVRFTSGSAAFDGRIAKGTSHAVQRLLDAGAIVIGTTNTPEYGYMGKTDSLVAGPTSTPFNLDLNSGGSSGGSAAAVADGLIPFGTGSDGAGSIRIPASFTGTYGFNPSFRRIARPEGTPFEGGSTFTQQGVQTRTVEDTALALSVMAGPTATDPHCLPNDVDYLGALEKGVEGLKVAYCPDLGVYPVDRQVREVIDEAVETISEAGATVEVIDVDLGLEYEELIESLRIMWTTAYAEVAGNLMADYGIDVVGADRELFPDELIGLVEYGRSLSAMDVAMNNRQRTRIHRGIQAVFEEYDLLVTSTLSVPPFPNDELGPTEIEGVETDPILGWLITAVFNMTGNPAASVPAGLTDEGLPVGMQLVGPRLADETVLAASAAYETVNPWYADYPGL